MRAIVVADKHWGIGKKNDLLFHLPADMKHFRETTAGKVVVMGSNTLASFPEGNRSKTARIWCSFRAALRGRTALSYSLWKSCLRK